MNNKIFSLLMTVSLCFSVQAASCNLSKDSKKPENKDASESGDKEDDDDNDDFHSDDETGDDNDEATDGDIQKSDDEETVESDAGESDTGDNNDEITNCEGSMPLACGDRFSHSTLHQGRPNEWRGYNCSARAESGREAIYAFRSLKDSKVTVELTNITADLDLFLLTACDPFSCIAASPTPGDIQDNEIITFDAPAMVTYYIAVDGYTGETDMGGYYDIAVVCHK